MKKILLIPLILATTGCSTMSKVANPFYESPSEVALLGEKNDSAISSGSEKDQKARAALEALSTYERSGTPAPYKPVVNAPVIRLMWVPDHINTHGDLVPAHYYYLKVKGSDFAASDAFEIEEQLHVDRGDSSNIPYVPADERIK